jgi:hypothetical protein
LVEPHVHDSHLVHSQSTSLVRANHVGGTESLNSVHTLDEHVLLCQTVASDRQTRGDSCGQTLRAE